MATLTPDLAENTAVKPCSIKLLPTELWDTAATTAVKINPTNALAMHQFKQAFPAVELQAEYLAIMIGKYWGAGGINLGVGFLDNPEPELRARILGHMNAWSQYANVSFTETDNNPEVRIARTAGDGYWSYLGTDILHIDANKPTMNLDSFSMNTPESEFFRVVRHETGHTLGFPHEHMRAEIVDRIDPEKAITYFGNSDHWSRQQVIAQVLTPIDASALIATAHADPNSIMCYWLPKQIMKDGISVPGGVDIDQQDAAFAAKVYPKTAALTPQVQ